jgi:hypothetical protein
MKFCLLALCAPALIFASGQQGQFEAGSLSWLAGCWEGNYANGRIVSEQWMKPLGRVMMGMSRTVRNGKTIAFEHIRIEQADDGSISYIANPSGQQEATFRLVELSGTRAVFENPEHDYPQRIIYELVTRDSLSARIEGMIGGELKSSGFPYRRVSCE